MIHQIFSTSVPKVTTKKQIVELLFENSGTQTSLHSGKTATPSVGYFWNVNSHVLSFREKILEKRSNCRKYKSLHRIGHLQDMDALWLINVVNVGYFASLRQSLQRFCIRLPLFRVSNFHLQKCLKNIISWHFGEFLLKNNNKQLTSTIISCFLYQDLFRDGQESSSIIKVVYVGYLRIFSSISRLKTLLQSLTIAICP